MTLERFLIEVTRFAILLLMAAIGVGSIQLSNILNRRIRPLSEILARQHQNETSDELSHDLEICKNRYVSLLENVDNIDTAEFSAGWIETLNLSFNGRTLTAATAQAWIRQVPSILISLGLLGTFAGLTVGLGRISGVLAKNVNPTQAVDALSELLQPMATAFETSLLGLLLSLIVLIWTQINGTRSCLERCESLLSSWLETVLPQQLGERVMAPLRDSLQRLNTTTGELPLHLSVAIEAGMNKAFNAKLNQLFDSQADLAVEANSAVRALSIFASTLNESGQDFVDAAQVFQQSDFATTLEASVHGLLESRELLTASTEALSSRLLEVRDTLLTTQADWGLLAKAAEQELGASRIAREEFQVGIKTLQSATYMLEQSMTAASESAKQLREARLEVMRDRKLAIETATAIQQRLTFDNESSTSLQAFAGSLESMIINWNSNVEHLNALSIGFIESVRNAKLEDENILRDRSQLASQTIANLHKQLLDELGQTIADQRTALELLAPTAQSAKTSTEMLLTQLEQLKNRVEVISLATYSSNNEDRTN